MQSYKASYILSKEVIAPAILHHARSSRQARPVFLWVLGLLGAAVGLLSLAFPPLDSPKMICATVCLSFSVWLVFQEPLSVWGLTQGIVKSKYNQSLVEYQVLPETLTVRSFDGTYQEFPWHSFIRVVETNEGFLLYLQKTHFIWLPFDAFEELDGVVKLREYVRLKDVPCECR